MFEAKLGKASVLKLVLESVKELVTDVNFDCDEEGMKLQAMDNSHVALVALQLRAGGFTQYRCDRSMTLGINIGSFQKIVKCAANEDVLTLRAQDDADLLNVIFETLKTDRMAEYEMKMMDIDIEHLGIPETVYDAEITLPSTEFNRIIKDLKEMGESVRIEATKEGVKFSAKGDIGKGSVVLKHTANKPVVVDGGDGEEEEEEDEEEDDDNDDDDDDDEDEDEDEDKENDEDDGGEETVKKEKKLQKEPKAEPEAAEDATQDSEEKDEEKAKVKMEIDSEGETAEKEDGKETTQKSEEDGDSDEERPKFKKRKLEKVKKEKVKKKNVKKQKETNGKAKTKVKKGNAETKDEEDLSVSIALQQSVSLTFSIKYLSNFTKASPLAQRVTLHMSNEVPLLVAYEFETGYVRYYLAPKIEDD